MKSRIPDYIPELEDLPRDADLATRQWAEWQSSRRHLLKLGAMGGAALAAGVVGPGLKPFVRSAGAQDTPMMGGSIAMSLADEDVQSFDPPVPTDNMSIWTMLLIYDTLIRVGPDGNSLEPGLATEWTKSDDGLTFTFKLREATFHDGTAFTAADAVYSMGRVMASEGWSFLFPKATYTATDDRTMTAALEGPWAPFEADLALFGASIIPKAAHEAQGDQLFQSPIGTGPFVFGSWNKGADITLTKYAGYWDQPKPYLDELRFVVLTDANARMLQFQGGDLDIVTSVPFSQIETLKANPDVNFHEGAVARIDYWGINVTRAPLSDIKVRQAINYAVNKDAIIENVLFGAGQPANTFLPLMYGHDPNVPGYTYNLDMAKQLLAESSSPDGFEVEVLIAVGNPIAAQVSQLVANDLKQIGITLKVTELEPAAQRDRRNAFDFDMISGYYTTDIIDPDELTNFAVESDGGAFAVWTQYRNDAVNAKLVEARVELDPEKRLALYSELQTMVTADAHFLYLYYPTGNTASQSFVQNFSILPTGNYRLWETWRNDL